MRTGQGGGGEPYHFDAMRAMPNSVATRWDDSSLRLQTTTISTPSMAWSSCANGERRRREIGGRELRRRESITTKLLLRLR